VFIYPIPEATDTSNDTCLVANESREFLDMLSDPSQEEEPNNTLELSPVCKNKKYSRLDESSIVDANA
jgi:hypothetical protein